MLKNGLQILPAYEDYFKLSSALASLNVAIVALGSVFAVPVGATVSNRYGRKWGIAHAAIVAMIGAIIQ